MKTFLLWQGIYVYRFSACFSLDVTFILLDLYNIE